jgi:hypothetical protein
VGPLKVGTLSHTKKNHSWHTVIQEKQSLLAHSHKKEITVGTLSQKSITVGTEMQKNHCWHTATKKEITVGTLADKSQSVHCHKK